MSLINGSHQWQQFIPHKPVTVPRLQLNISELLMPSTFASFLTSICVKDSLSLVFLDFNEMEKVAFKFKDFWYNITRKKV